MNKQTNHRQFPYTKNDRYYNYPDDCPESFLFQTIPSFISSLYGRKKRQPENKNEWLMQEKPLDHSKDPVITWIGHASFLIQVAEINILTDPIFGNASMFFPRVLPPGIALEHLPRIDYVMISHNHRDHCDVRSLKALRKANPHMVLLVPKGDKHWLEKRGLGPVIEHAWWQQHAHQTNEGSIIFTFLPAHHWSAQGIFDRNKSLWGSWMISVPVRIDGNYSIEANGISNSTVRVDGGQRPNGDHVEIVDGPSILLRQAPRLSLGSKRVLPLILSLSKDGGQVRTQPVRHPSRRIFDAPQGERKGAFTPELAEGSEGATAGDVYHIYFAGDTSYSEHFSHIAQEFSSIHMALMPIAPEKPHPWMRKSHLNAQQAVQAFIDLKADHFVPMHWGTFQFGLDTFHGPIDRLKEAWNGHNLSEKKLTIAKVGQRVSIL